MPYKSVSMRPYRAELRTGRGESALYSETPLEGVLDAIASDAKSLSQLVEWQLNSEPDIGFKVKAYVEDRPRLAVAKVGEYMGFRIPSELIPGPSGKSRFERMFQARVVSEALSWHERTVASRGESDKRVSRGWQRTANDMAPSNLTPKLPVSSTDDSYYKFVENPVGAGRIVLDLVISGRWHRLYFKFDGARFSGAKKVCAPDVVVSDGRVRFHFPIEYAYQYSDIDSEYRIGVDLGLVKPATVTVVNRDGDIVHSSTLSRRVASLRNSIVATERQVRSLQKRNRRDEAALHRRANVGKKREMAILIGQEIAEIQHDWGNAVLAVEDLSWIANTMSSGRWNRGEVVKWVTHFCSLNGGLVMKRSAAHTSKNCHSCDTRGKLRDRDIVCANEMCGLFGAIQDRDINAAANIAMRLKMDTVDKCQDTRARRRKTLSLHGSKNKLNTTRAKQSLRYPGRDRTKTGPTPKRVKRKATVSVSRESLGVNSSGTSGAIRPTVSLDAPGGVSQVWDRNRLPDYARVKQKRIV